MLPAFNPVAAAAGALHELGDAGCPIFGDGSKQDRQPPRRNLWYIGPWPGKLNGKLGLNEWLIRYSSVTQRKTNG
jgi:hypothetical protein